MKFGEKLQKLRKENNLSQEQLADMLDVTRQSVSKWESSSTYPEMDKLLSMCKIFKCSLDDLTNEDITDVNTKNKQKNNFTNILDEISDMLSKSIDMFKGMSAKDITKFIIEMGILFLILLVFKLPFIYVYHLGYEIFINLGMKIGNILSSILNLILNVAYFILFVVIFVYIYKMRYLDRYDSVKVENGFNENVKHENNKSNISDKVEKDENRHSFTIFKVLGNLFILFVKFIMACIGFPFIISLVFLFMCLVISIILIFKGVFFFGIILGIISSILLIVWIIELIFNFVFNRKSNLNRTFITLIVALAFLGIAFGITIFDITSFKYYDKVPSGVELSTIKKEYDMGDELIFDDFHYNTKYEIDNSLNDKIVVEVLHYDKYTNVDILKNDNHIYINTYDKDKVVLSDLSNMIIENLSNKEFYNYNDLYYCEVKISGSETNINRLKENYDNYYNQIAEKNRKSDEIMDELSKRNTMIQDLENENMELKDEIEEYKNKLQEYKDNLNSIISD